MFKDVARRNHREAALCVKVYPVSVGWMTSATRKTPDDSSEEDYEDEIGVADEQVSRASSS